MRPVRLVSRHIVLALCRCGRLRLCEGWKYADGVADVGNRFCARSFADKPVFSGSTRNSLEEWSEEED
jgi:hypothetical protein